MIVYITKWVLTRGILEREANIEREDTRKLLDNRATVSLKEDGFARTYIVGEGKDWHKDFESAKCRAENVRGKRIEALERQLSRLKDLNLSRPRVVGDVDLRSFTIDKLT